MAGPTTAERGARPRSKSGRSPEEPVARRFRLPGRRLMIVLIMASVLLAGGTWALYGSNWLRVERVSTSGAEVLTRAEVESAAAVPVGAPLISVDTDAIEARLRRKLPRIDSVEVARSWPHGISLKVIERKPVLLIEKGAKFIEVDGDGVRFAEVEKAPAGVPGLELTVDQTAVPRRFGTGRLILEAVRARSELPRKVAADTRKVRVRSYDSISLELTGGRTVMWGSAEDGTAKARALAALMKAAPKAAYFDVSAPTAPAASGS
ncbi:FtsQ-type POTRA domain-containing protein [Streptomyces sp. MnatMP-M17]|uniref:cell division protein FtsQ/DivIB n=1 Tax=unclassified Streptomyces TaxID=2593676 RepID=UPI000B817E34|nr:FtsQ-type POTRA domain-containing protein [Streptomyces sp. MnatMP-M17]MYZ40588.1 FtsQ-type POTRA domain-containing protein [Streptomyces sp. SID4917]